MVVAAPGVRCAGVRTDDRRADAPGGRCTGDQLCLDWDAQRHLAPCSCASPDPRHLACRVVGAAHCGCRGRGSARRCRFDLRHHPGRALDAAAANHARGRPLTLLACVSQLLCRSRGRRGNSDADATFSHPGRGAPHQPVNRHLSRRTLRLWRGFCRDRRDDCHDSAPRSSAQQSRGPANGRGQQPGRPDRDLPCGRDLLPAPGLPRGGGFEHRRQPADLHGQRNLPDPASQAVGLRQPDHRRAHQPALPQRRGAPYDVQPPGRRASAPSTLWWSPR